MTRGIAGAAAFGRHDLDQVAMVGVSIDRRNLNCVSSSTFLSISSSLPCTGLQPKSIGDSVAGRVSSRRLFIRSSVQLSERGRMSRPFIYETNAF